MSNFVQTLKLLRKYNEGVSLWFERSAKPKRISHDVQNEKLQMIAEAVIRGVVADINKAKFFSVTADEATHVSNQ